MLNVHLGIDRHKQVYILLRRYGCISVACQVLILQKVCSTKVGVVCTGSVHMSCIALMVVLLMVECVVFVTTMKSASLYVLVAIFSKSIYRVSSRQLLSLFT